jgi:hypothetical protein
MDKRELQFWNCVKKLGDNDCWEWQFTKTKAGYGTVNYKSERTTAHRIAYKLTKGEIPQGLIVMHSCDNRACCNPAHLSIATQKENIHDMIKKGRSGDCRNFGKNHGGSKVTEAIAKEILKQYSETAISQQRLSEIYGISQTHISRLIRGESKAVL